jgi:hypothetical protein
MKPTRGDLLALLAVCLIGILFVATLTGYIRLSTPTQAQRQMQQLEAEPEITIWLDEPISAKEDYREP